MSFINIIKHMYKDLPINERCVNKLQFYIYIK